MANNQSALSAKVRRSQRVWRSPQEWAVRGLAAAVTAGLGYYCVIFSVAQVTVRGNPASAYRMVPNSGAIAGDYAAGLMRENLSLANALARRALMHDPTAIGAIVTLGINAQLHGDVGAARRLFAYGQRLSRRDNSTQLWAIEDAVARNDIPDVLRHYDVALRTSPNLADILYPVLASASADPAIRSALIRTLIARPPWGDGFLIYMSGKGPDPEASARFLQGMAQAKLTVPAEAIANTVNALLAIGHGDDAWAVYQMWHPKADRRYSRDPRFTGSRQALSVLDWIPIDGDGLTASIQAGQRGGILDFVASSSASGPVARQIQLLPAGTYRLTGHSTGPAQAQDAQPYWTIRCQNNLEIARVSLANVDGDAGSHQEVIFKVPAGCPLQILELVVRPSDNAAGSNGQIDYLKVEPIR